MPVHKKGWGCTDTGAGDGNRTRMTSLEGWSSTIELHPRGGTRRHRHQVAYRLPGTYRRATARTENIIGTVGCPAGSRYRPSGPPSMDENRANIS
jgi:hypothetical protein